MALKIRLARGGAKKRPYYRIVVAEGSAPRDGRFVERIGSYNPMVPKDHPERLTLDGERALYWVSKGAKPTERVHKMMAGLGLIAAPVLREQPKKSAPGKKRVERETALAEAAAEPPKAPAETAAEAPAEAPAETAAEAPAEAPAETAAEAPAEAPAETAAEAPAEAPAETAAEAPAEAPAETEAEAPAEAPAEEAPAEPAAETPAEEAPAEPAAEDKEESKDS